MATEVDMQSTKKSDVKRLKFLPRIGIYIDFAGKEFVFKHAPLIETIANVVEQGLNIQNVLKVSKQQLAEIKFPKHKTASEIINASATTISIEQKSQKQRKKKN